MVNSHAMVEEHGVTRGTLLVWFVTMMVGLVMNLGELEMRRTHPRMIAVVV